MARESYRHSAYWYAYHNGWTYSEAGSYSGAYLDLHTYRPRMKERPDGGWRGKDWLAWRSAPRELDSGFNPLLLGVAIAMDIGVAMRDGVGKLADPHERERMRLELMRDLRAVRRPFYYARETERRRRMAAERRKLNRRYTTAPAPTPEALLAAWEARKESREAMIRLGGMLQDLECYVDNCLKIDESGAVVGRNGGIRGWIRENLPELSPKYKTLMRYKALAIRLRQATDTRDPTPTSALLEGPHHEALKEILSDPAPVFSRVFDALEHRLSPDTVFLDPAKRIARRSKARKRLKKQTAAKRMARKRMLR